MQTTTPTPSTPPGTTPERSSGHAMRVLRHLLTTRRHVARLFPPASLTAIEAAIQRSEATHTGEIRFAVEAALDGAPLWRGQPPRERAIEVFSSLRIWDTARNNGILIYLLVADRAVEIVADRGIDAAVGPAAWSAVCRDLQSAVRSGDAAGGVLRAVEAVTRALARHFPAGGAEDNPDELPNRPVVL